MKIKKHIYTSTLTMLFIIMMIASASSAFSLTNHDISGIWVMGTRSNIDLYQIPGGGGWISFAHGDGGNLVLDLDQEGSVITGTIMITGETSTCNNAIIDIQEGKISGSSYSMRLVHPCLALGQDANAYAEATGTISDDGKTATGSYTIFANQRTVDTGVWDMQFTGDTLTLEETVEEIEENGLESITGDVTADTGISGITTNAIIGASVIVIMLLAIMVFLIFKVRAKQ